MIIYCLLIFIFGLIVGSFLNCAIYRLEKKESFLQGRSYCPHCKRALAWCDLVPLISFIALKRRCRYCKKPISWQYPLVELATGILFVSIFWHLSLGFDLSFGFCHLDFLTILYYLLIACFLIVIFVYDLKHFIILDKVLIPAIILSIFYRPLESIINYQLSPARIATQSVVGGQSVAGGIINYLCAAFGAAGLFLLIYLISRGKWIGFADIKLAMLLGLILGWPKIALSLFLSFFIGAIIGIGLIVFSGKKLKSEIPFAPFLIAGTLIAFFWGQGLINWYFSLIF
ncbi:prepilin peptidase [Patescibacteria group bacterium]|nr:prepilin peptidase [Patescibacteria group bacterium]